jgi:hypothetical protein
MEAGVKNVSARGIHSCWCCVSALERETSRLTLTSSMALSIFRSWIYVGQLA